MYYTCYSMFYEPSKYVIFLTAFRIYKLQEKFLGVSLQEKEGKIFTL